MDKVGRPRNYPYYFLFFASGFPALLYQIVWQRALFTLYGVNIESVTIIVAAFMLGLGLGSLAGGQISKRAKLPLLTLFACIEMSIGIFGAVSLNLFRMAGRFTAGATAFETGLIAFGLLLVPTVLMGSTLPLLAAYLVRRNGNMGESVGALYSVNTFGSAVACFLAAYFLMGRFGESGSVRLAASVNIFVACLAILLHFVNNSGDPEPSSSNTRPVPRRTSALTFRKALIVAWASGFIALGYEIVWYRLYSFATGGPASCFALMLAWYLAGVAYGSLAVRDMCRGRLRDGGDPLLATLKSTIIWGSFAAFLLGPAVGVLANFMVSIQSVPYSLVFIGAALFGAVFPLVSHASIQPDASDAGAKLSWLYLSNILGCTAGSLLVGFVLMDYVSIQATAEILLAFGLILAFAIRPAWSFPPRQSLALGCIVLISVASWPSYSRLYERLLLAQGVKSSLRHIVETRSGVVAVDNTGTVYGGGVYDGRFNTDLVTDSNGILRAYAIDSFQPGPKDILVIGLSSGSWTQVLANNPRVENITVIEINPGYLTLIPQYPAVASLLHNAKVHMVIDDGRRWLRRNPGRRFDLVVSNTTFHWRAHTSNLLSVEFLKLIRQHLKPGGVHYYNTTNSEEALLTGVTVFPYGLRVFNFLAVSDSPIIPDKERWRRDLADLKIDDKPVIGRGAGAVLNDALHIVDSLANADPKQAAMESGESLRKRLANRRVVTDDNMATEWAQ